MRSPLPLGTRFRLGSEITPEQRLFLDTHGYLVFDQVGTRDEMRAIIAELDRIEAEWLAEGRKKVNGVPIFFGRREDGRPFVQRFAFTSLYSDVIRDFVHDPRLVPLRSLVGQGARIGDREKDGVVVNRYLNVPGSVYQKLGWHTDGLRDLFYFRMPGPMLNVGVHLDDCPLDNGGLRLIPGTHEQGFADMCLRKPYFVSHAPDPAEIAVETRAGDVTVHDGRLWHRVAQSTRTGAESVRHSMYVPYLTDAYQPKDESSPTRLYQHAAVLSHWMKRR
jgi:ectoine hydroxylase-related dioxygenase (phytanoyl-CoA dioxygenase family)